MLRAHGHLLSATLTLYLLILGYFTSLVDPVLKAGRKPNQKLNDPSSVSDSGTGTIETGGFWRNRQKLFPRAAEPRLGGVCGLEVSLTLYKPCFKAALFL